jgi:hypothetical protein
VGLAILRAPMAHATHPTTSEVLPAAEGAAEGSAPSNVGEVRDEALAEQARVHEAGTFDKGLLRWGYFLLLNAIAGSVAIAFFIAVFYADGLDPYLAGTYEWLLAHPGVTSALAFSPLACSLLVGYGYSMRAIKRKRHAAALAATHPPAVPHAGAAAAEQRPAGESK